MRALLMHCKNYGVKVTRLANRPKGINPEAVKEKEQFCNNCIVAMITVEKEDVLDKSIPLLSKEIITMSNEIKRKQVVLLPFAHLSNNLANIKKGIDAITMLENSIKNNLHVVRAHFGSHKELLLNLYGHPGNARYREFY